MFEVQLMNHVKQRKRSGQVSASFAEQCLRRIYRGDLALADLDEHSFDYHAGAWDPTVTSTTGRRGTQVTET